MGRALRSLGLAPDVVLVSSARRTLQTLEALEPWDETPLIEPLDALYLASAPQIMAILQRVTDTVRSVMVIGHNPGLHDLALTLAGAHALSARTEPTSRLASGVFGRRARRIPRWRRGGPIWVRAVAGWCAS